MNARTALSATDYESITDAEGLPEIFAYVDETCRAVAEEMATQNVMSMPVVDRETGSVCGTISAQDLLVGRRRAVIRESERSITFLVES